jgi:multidrug efflux pump subunit AcrA (membrane-fusion protein)
VGTIGSSGATYPVLIGFEAEQSLVILPNMSAKVKIITKQIANTLVVPTVAISYRDGAPTVKVITGGDDKNPVVEERTIAVGESDSSNTQVLSGLRSGEKIQMADFRSAVGSAQDDDLETIMRNAKRSTGAGGPPSGANRPSGNSGSVQVTAF